MPHLFGWHIIPKKYCSTYKCSFGYSYNHIFYSSVSPSKAQPNKFVFLCDFLSVEFLCFILFSDGKWNLFDIPNEPQ